MKIRVKEIAAAIAAVLCGTIALANPTPIDPSELAAPATPIRPPQHLKPTAHRSTPDHEVELTTKAAILNSGFGTKSAFASSVPSPDATTLSPPVTLTYSGGSPVVLVNDSGTNKGVESVINNTHNSTSALYGSTNGSGAGLTGYNSGTGGPAGKFGITNASSMQSAVTTTTNGGGSALLATITSSQSDAPAILGQNQVAANFGTGVEGLGSDYGVQGYGGYGGVYASGDGLGVWGYSSGGSGVFGESFSATGVTAYSDSSYGSYSTSKLGIGSYAFSYSNYGMSANSHSSVGLYANSVTSGFGILAHSGSGTSIFASSDTGYGIRGQSKNTYAVIGEDSGSGVGVYGYSATGYAGSFQGPVTATSYATSSDRNVKTHIRPVDGQEILARVDRLPVDSWVFKNDLEKKHVGPMAQDFHAAFGLDGEDDKHINLTDIAGVSLVAIKELSSELKQKDAQIASLKQQLKAIDESFSARLTALEQQQVSVVIQAVNLSQDTGVHGR